MRTPQKTGRRYRVVAHVTISMHTDVVADSEEEARAKAQERGVMGRCWQCARGASEGEWVTSGELDGTPDEIIDVMPLDDE